MGFRATRAKFPSRSSRPGHRKREMLTVERMPRNGRGGVLLRELPLLTGHGPQLVMVQPRDVLEGLRVNNKNKENGKSKRIDINGNCKAVRERPLQAIDISPDFSTFLDRPQTDERSRGGSRDKEPTNVEVEDDLLSGLTTRKPSWNFESILKEIEEDSIMSNSSSSSTSTEPGDALPFPQDLIEIPLESQDGSEYKNAESRRSTETQEALSRLFDQLLSDVYSHNLQPWQAEGPERRSSDSRLPQFYRNYEHGHLNRQMSFPGALSEQRGSNRHRRSLPVRSLSGIDRSSFCSLTTIGHSIGHNSFAEDLEETLLCENKLKLLPLERIQEIKFELESNVALTGKLLVFELEEKDNLSVEQHGLCEIVTASLQAISSKTSDDAKVKFSLTPATHDHSGFQEWARAMRMVARLPDGVPTHFRKNLWLSLAERHLHTKGGVSWAQTERRLFSETTSAEDKELSVQIVKDLHRTGCSLFCGVTGQHNQAVLKRVLLAYARWNSNVGYCQGLNMLAALILQVMQGSQSATVKVMIYLIEGVLPESYFANNLRGLSVDMAVFRDLLRLKLPDLSRHLDHLQQDSKDSGTSYEPPLCDVFTMQWFLTLFSNCLPQSTVLRVWDLVFLEGDQILLRTALAIWQSLSDRMMSVRSADEFYSIMAVLTREMMEFGLMEPNSLIKAIDNMSIPEVGDLREKYIYNISPWAVGTVAKMGVKLLYPDHGSPSHEDPYKEQRDQKLTPFSNHPDREKIALDISALKRQYWKLRERQRQAHIILSANDVSACRSDNLTTSSSPALNHLLLGKRALLSAKGRRIEGTVPSSTADQRRRQPPPSTVARAKEGTTLTWREARRRSRKGAVASSRSPSSSSSSSSSTELCDSSDSEESGDAGKTSDVDKSLPVDDITTADVVTSTDDVRKTEMPSSRSSGSPSPQPPVNDDSRLPSAGSERLSSTIVVDDLAARLETADWDPRSSDVADGTTGSSPRRGGSPETRSWEAGDRSPDCISPELASIRSPDLSTSDVTKAAAQSPDVSTSEVTRAVGSSLSSITRVDNSEMANTRLDSLEAPADRVDSSKAKEIRKAPSSSQLGSLEAKWSRPPISSYSSIQLGAAAAAEQSRVTSSSFSSTQLGSVESGSTYSSLSSLPKDDTLSSDWSKKLGDFPPMLERTQKPGETPLSSPDKSQTVEEKLKRRKSEIALLQILQENSQILQRIHQAHKMASPDEPEDIKEIRRRYGYRQSSSLDSPKTPKSAENVVNPFRRTPSTLTRDVTIKLGLYPDRA